MGNRTLIRNAKANQVNIQESAKNIEKILSEISPRLDTLHKDMQVGVMAEINKIERRKVIAKTILNMSAAPAMFIPFAGPFVAGALKATSSIVDTINNPLDINTCAMVIGITLETAYKAPLFPTYVDGEDKGVMSSLQDKTKGLLPVKERTITAYNGKGDSQQVVTVAKDQLGNALDAGISSATTKLQSAPIQKVGKYQSAPSTNKAVDRELTLRHLIYTESKVRETMDQALDDTKRYRLLPLLFWKICTSESIEGHGTLLLNSLDLKTTNDHNKWISIERAKRLLGGQGNEHLARIARKCGTSEFVKEVRKEFDYRSYNILNEYEITPIYIEKIRLIAYRDRYRDALYKLINTSFLHTIFRDAQRARRPIFDKRFYKSESYVVEDCTSKNLNTTYANNAHQYRRKMVYSCYCFHQMLTSHLGTYFLSSLPAIGTSDIENDKKIALAIVDAYATSWWATSKAFKASRKINLTESHELQKLMISEVTLDGIPYIANYFSHSKTLREHISLTADNDANRLAREKIVLSLISLIEFIEELSPYDMMPLDNNIKSKIDRKSFNETIKSTLRGKYQHMLNRFSDDVEFPNIVNAAHATPLNDLDFNKYDSLLHNTSSKYDHLLNQNANDRNPINGLDNTKDSLHIKQKMRTNLNLAPVGPETQAQARLGSAELSEDIANLRMLSTMSIKGTANAFDQYDFNAKLVDTLEKILKHIGG
ncbi:hypothetical protein LO80_06245 [Candidatus Francisella endociliophora]|uniref:Uncharacterized protein n=1 Tax=Candidatus Francisella endociliophora TaxID=653937 RepID=A0A097EPV5_9GAMM|nr:hypothetical protein [Francisella sp. FSC1006]AIT09600.1 hypothetical protein LO80_06245 [Francisella sp. FSC1006]